MHLSTLARVRSLRPSDERRAKPDRSPNVHGSSGVYVIAAGLSANPIRSREPLSSASAAERHDRWGR